ncbi:cytoplasmic protein [Clostridium beijerinckii]|uniref:cytoplasmic protein n=1 Tax=Clostridium beijerinckii TaxID=1520 RepID=UPI001FA90746|nr:cytoplasmic protein [Clostridium beijerinckii]UYZ38878.1 cytoplasmic protein [Clostridium beijerinckii]
MKNFFHQKLEVSELQKINNTDILFKVKNGHGKLKKKYVKDKNDNIKEAYFLGNTPLVMTNSQYCPTCSVLIQLAEGREKVDSEVIKIINNINSVQNVEDGFHKIKPILSLLEDGYYVLKEIELVPTDGEGNYFWKLDGASQNYNASADLYYDCKCVVGEPKFMVPSQGMECYNQERVDYYREKIRNGEKLFGIAIELRGFMALLIDGHHKATAAYLEGKTLGCITIINPYLYRYENGKEGISYLDEEIPFSKLDSGKEIKEFINNRKSDKNNYQEIILENKYSSSINLRSPKIEFIDYKTFALSTLAEDTSDNKILELLNYKGEDPIEELEYIFYKLEVNNKPKARELSFKIINKEEFQSLWGICINFLTQYSDEEVQDLFVNFLVESDAHNCIGYDYMKNMIDNYFRNIL